MVPFKWLNFFFNIGALIKVVENMLKPRLISGNQQHNDNSNHIVQRATLRSISK